MMNVQQESDARELCEPFHPPKLIGVVCLAAVKTPSQCITT